MTKGKSTPDGREDNPHAAERFSGTSTVQVTMKGRSSNRTRSSRFPATSPSSSLPSYVPFSMLVLPTPGSRAGIVVGLLLAGSAPTTSFVPSSTSSVRGLSSPSLDTQVHHRRACVRPRQRAIGTGSMRLSASGPGETGGYEGEGRAEDIDSSELYADLRRRMEVRVWPLLSRVLNLDITFCKTPKHTKL